MQKNHEFISWMPDTLPFSTFSKCIVVKIKNACSSLEEKQEQGKEQYYVLKKLIKVI